MPWISIHGIFLYSNPGYPMKRFGLVLFPTNYKDERKKQIMIKIKYESKHVFLLHLRENIYRMPFYLFGKNNHQLLKVSSTEPDE